MSAPTNLYSGFHNATIDLKKMRVIFHDNPDLEGQLFKLVRRKAGSQRDRGELSKKHLHQESVLLDRDFSTRLSEYSMLYGNTYHRLGEIPSIRQVMEGLYLHYVE